MSGGTDEVLDLPVASVSYDTSGVPDDFTGEAVDYVHVHYLNEPGGYRTLTNIDVTQTFTDEWRDFTAMEEETDQLIIRAWAAAKGAEYTLDKVRGIQRSTSAQRLLAVDYKNEVLTKVYCTVYPATDLSWNVVACNQVTGSPNPGSGGGSGSYTCLDSMVLNYLGDHTLYEYITIASAYSDRKFDEYYVDAPAITSTYRKPHTCIRHMDIRNDSLYLGHSEQWDTIYTTYIYIIPYDNFYGYAYKNEISTTEIERDQWIELRSLGHPNVELWQPTESTEVDTSEIITPVQRLAGL